MTSLNSILCTVFDALLSPFRELHPAVGLFVAAVPFTIAVLLVLKKTSNQRKIEAVKRKIHAGLFEIRLFNDDLRAILRAQWDILRHNGTYLALWLVPMLWMSVPMMLILGQMHFHYGYRGLGLYEDVLLEVELKNPSVTRPDVELAVPDGLTVKAGPLWIPSLGEVSWRLAARERGDYELGVTLDGETYTKSLSVSEAVARRSPVRPSPGFLDQLLYPAEPPLPAAAPIHQIRLSYPPGDAGLPGWERTWTWMLVFFVFLIILALLLRKPLKVTF